MNLLAANLVDQFFTLIWPLLRISAFLTFASIYSIRAVNLRVRITLALVLTIFLVLQLRLELPRIDPLTVEGLREIFNQLFIGFTMALIMQLATASVVVAGQAVSNSMGLSIANMIVWHFVGLVSVFPHWQDLVQPRLDGQDHLLELHCVCWLGVDLFAGHDHLALCQRGVGFCHACSTEFEHLFGWISGHDVHGFFGPVVGHSQYLVKN